MALVICPDCGGRVSDQAAACIHCGRPMNVERGKLYIFGKKDGWKKHLYYLYDSNGNFFDEVPVGEEKCYHIDRPITLILSHKRGSFAGCAVKDAAPVHIDPQKVTYLEASIYSRLGDVHFCLVPRKQ